MYDKRQTDAGEDKKKACVRTHAKYWKFTRRTNPLVQLHFYLSWVHWPKDFIWGVRQVGFFIDRKRVLKRPYSKLWFGTFLRLMLEEMVVQNVQQLSEFSSDNDGWPLKSKLLSCFIKLELNETFLLLTSACFSCIFLPKIQNNDLRTSSWRHNDATNSDFCQTF